MNSKIWSIILLFLLGTTIACGQHGLFAEWNDFFSVTVKDGRVDYKAAVEHEKSERITKTLQNIQLKDWKGVRRKALLINAYNFFTIHAVGMNLPIGSVREVPGFFTAKEHNIGGRSFSLDEIEKRLLLSEFEDPRIHFALNCGASDCPPLKARAYLPDSLEDQLDEQTRRVMMNRNFIRVNALERTISLSPVFKWYSEDFGSMKQVRDYINDYRFEPLPDYDIEFYSFDWALNAYVDQGMNMPPPNTSRYIISSTIPKGGIEIKLFNNLYTERIGAGEELTDRNSYFTSFLSVVYGYEPHLSIGFDLRFRRVAQGSESDPFWDVLTFSRAHSTASAIATVGPKIRWAPFGGWPNFSVQSAFWIPLKNDLEGNASKPYLDWNGPAWITQFFNDFDIGTQYSLFTEIDVWGEDLGTGESDYNRWSTPVTAIFSYFPNRQLSFYILGNIAPIWAPELDFYAQSGLGSKYQITPDFELEFLYTYFTSAGLIDGGGRAATYNLGIRFTR